jgi:hypothetical protein
MTFEEIQFAAFRDELTRIKTAGEMQGATRIGRKPIGVERLLEREAEVEGLPDFMEETAVSAAKSLLKMAGKAEIGVRVSHKALGLVGAGGAGALVARRANEDRKLGRLVRKQQEQGQQ